MLRKATVGLLLAAMLAGACGGGSADDPATEVSSTISESESDNGPTSTVADDDRAAETTTTAAPAIGETTTSAAETSLPVLEEEGEEEEETAPVGPLSPFTGLPVEDPSRLERKVIAVKIDNHWNARPQSGILEAEAIVEMVVESGITRFIALFHHSDTDWVGPVRSGRPTDWTVVRPLNGALAISGAQSWVVSLINRNDVPLIGDMGPPLTHRWGSRRAPHNLYLNTFEARRVAEQRNLDQTPPDAPIFNWGPLNAEVGSIATYILFDWSDTMDATWIWDGEEERYQRFVGEDPHNWHRREGDATEQIWADNLVVLRAERYRACPPSGNGSCVPAWKTTGGGDAMVFAEGRYAVGSWERADETEWFTLRDGSGREMTVPPGRSWIMIYPQNADIDYP